MIEVINDALASLERGDTMVNAYYLLSDRVDDYTLQKIRSDSSLGPVQIFLEHYCDAVEHQSDRVVGSITAQEAEQIIQQFVVELLKGHDPPVPSTVKRHCSYAR